jgi:hypothetical protein
MSAIEWPNVSPKHPLWDLFADEYMEKHDLRGEFLKFLKRWDRKHGFRPPSKRKAA